MSKLKDVATFNMKDQYGAEMVFNKYQTVDGNGKVKQRVEIFPIEASELPFSEKDIMTIDITLDDFIKQIDEVKRAIIGGEAE